jgi:hypothetical protein
MYELAEYGQLQPHRETGREAVTVREDRETNPYVVRDLSWELARYLDTENFPDSAATPESTREV